MTLAEFQSQSGNQIALVHAVYLLLFGGVTWTWLRRGGVEMSVFVTLVCFLPALVGVALAFTSREDEEQFRMRILACSLFTPVLLLFWSTSVAPAVSAPPRAAWPFGVGAAVLHAAAFAGSIFWFGTTVTRVPAVEGVAPVNARTLADRLLSLGGGENLSVNRAEDNQIVVELPAPSGRRQVVIVNLNDATHAATVKERLTLDGAKPIDASEASMRGPGEPRFDPKRPNASRISGKQAQTRTIEPAKLEAIPVTFQGSRVQLPAHYAASLGEDGIVTLLCAVVTRSGWDWQPVFFAD